MEVCVFVVVLIFVCAIAVVVMQAISQSKAKREYYASLDLLKRDPANPDLRERTLSLGRTYIAAVNAFNNNPAGAIYSEVMLMNDITAACARAHLPTGSVTASPPSVEDRLTKLEELRSKNLITDQEYQTRRQQVLADI